MRTDGTGQASFICPRCGMTSHHPEDVKNSYCGNCHEFFGPSLTSNLHPLVAFAVRYAGVGSLREVLFNWISEDREKLPRDNVECAVVVEAAIDAYLEERGA